MNWLQLLAGERRERILEGLLARFYNEERKNSITVDNKYPLFQDASQPLSGLVK